MIIMGEFIRTSTIQLDIDPTCEIDGILIYRCHMCNKIFEVSMTESQKNFAYQVEYLSLHNNYIRHKCNEHRKGVAELIGWEPLNIVKKDCLSSYNPKRCDNKCRFWTSTGAMSGICSFATTKGFYNGSINSNNYLLIQSVGCNSYEQE
jgi:hypothetical protein